jgi:hypothetical protein
MVVYGMSFRRYELPVKGLYVPAAHAVHVAAARADQYPAGHGLHTPRSGPSKIIVCD